MYYDNSKTNIILVHISDSSIGKSPSSENRHTVPKVHVTKKSTKTDAGRKIEKPKSTKVSDMRFVKT